MSRFRFGTLAAVIATGTATVTLTGPAVAQDGFSLTSPELVEGAALPADLKCARDGGDGVSPPLDWTNPPEGTTGFAVIMSHYPQGRTEGVDAPSQYWLLWNIPVGTSGIARGNPTSIGDEGADKDMNSTGYTPPCAPAGRPGGPPHRYTIAVYALSATLTRLPDHDDGAVDWAQMTAEMAGKVLATASLSFTN